MPRDASGHLVPGVVSPQRPVPAAIPRPEYVGRPGPGPYDGGDLYTADEVARVRAAGRIAAQAVELVGTAIRPGVTTDALDVIAHEFIVSQNAYPSTVGYRGFPKSVCTSINEVICHGIPDDTTLAEGDLVNIDITAYRDGMHGDLSKTFIVGTAEQRVVDLVERTEEAMRRGIKAVMPGRPLNVIGRAIESYAKRFGYGVVRDFTGHGIGTSFHSGLVVPHYDDPDLTVVMEEGMTFTIEPMLTLGTIDYDIWDDGWTVVTQDRRRSAQFEHTVLVTATGADILTLP